MTIEHSLEVLRDQIELEVDQIIGVAPCSRFVCALVCGMIQTAKLFSDTSATVRLIPLTAIEPLEAT